MKIRRCLITGIMVAIGTILLQGCGQNAVSDQTSLEVVNTSITKTAAIVETTEIAENTESEKTTETTEMISDYSFLGTESCEFIFMNQDCVTKITVNKEGGFYGEYHGFAQEDSGNDYPNGTLYYSYFRGNFKPAVKIDENTYETEVSEIIYDEELGNEQISDGQRSVFCIAYGIADTEKIQFFLYGTPLSQLPDDFLESVELADQKENADAKLEFHGLYSVDTKRGMRGYPSE